MNIKLHEITVKEVAENYSDNAENGKPPFVIHLFHQKTANHKMRFAASY